MGCGWRVTTTRSALDLTAILADAAFIPDGLSGISGNQGNRAGQTK
jgi:hypothetical protein